MNKLTGPDANIEITDVVIPPPPVYGMAHTFIQDEEHQRWVEQAVIRPEEQQNCDLFGDSLALDGRYAVVGAPNRDALVTGMNAGAAYVFNVCVTLHALHPFVTLFTHLFISLLNYTIHALVGIYLLFIYLYSPWSRYCLAFAPFPCYFRSGS